MISELGFKGLRGYNPLNPLRPNSELAPLGCTFSGVAEPSRASSAATLPAALSEGLGFKGLVFKGLGFRV